MVMNVGRMNDAATELVKPFDQIDHPSRDNCKENSGVFFMPSATRAPIATPVLETFTILIVYSTSLTL